jgi:hypothetical protein
MIEFFERIAPIPKAKRRGDLKSELESELSAILAGWPASSFAQDLMNGSINAGLERVLGPSEWLVRVPKDEKHKCVQKYLTQVRRVSSSAASPLDVWQQCPTACAACWYSVKDRLRLARDLLKAQESNDEPSGGRVFVQRGELRMYHKDAAERLGTSRSQFSRWRNDGVVPVWAQDRRRNFQRLIQAGQKGRMLVDNVNELEEMRNAYLERGLSAAEAKHRG